MVTGAQHERILPWMPYYSPKRSAALFLATLVSACAFNGQPADSSPEVVTAEPVAKPAAETPVQDTTIADLQALTNAQAFEIRQLKEELAATENRLIAASAQVQRLKVSVEESRVSADDAIAEVVRTQARLQGNVSQADAASNIAEAEIIFAGFANNPSPMLAKIQDQLEAASVQFDAENYGGAMYLSNQAKRSLSAVKEQTATLSPVANEESFGELVEMWLVSDSNLRQGPGLDHSVITVLDEGTKVLAYSFSGAWVRVQVDDIIEGWVFQPLLSLLNPLPSE